LLVAVLQLMHAPLAPRHAGKTGAASQVAPAQQPPHVAAQPLQVPLSQLWPLGHGKQAAPPVPQCAALGAAMQWSPSQQPPGQDSGVQVHAPFTHAWSEAHTSLAPQRHFPSLEQLSVRVASQAWQERPGPAHVALAKSRQMPLSQQPLGQLSVLQMQVPPVAHCMPVPQEGLAPQLQRPSTEQLSALPLTHATQAAPLLPQVPRLGARQRVPAQQPLVQVCKQPLHAPFWQLSPPGHCSQVSPAPPQALGLSPSVQAPSLQQPIGHDWP
jgi:hypothetical protein